MYPKATAQGLQDSIMLSYDISGLFTDGFSSCNILAVISIDKLILMHIDTDMLGSTKMLEQMQREIEWVDTSREVIVAFRNVEGGGRNVNMTLLTYFALHMPLVRMVEKEIDNDTHGLCLSFNTQKPSDIHPNIEKFPFQVRPEGLIHHPQERRFLAVQKIEQVIGQEEKLLSGLTKNKQFCLFNGGWESLGEAELKVDITHPITRTEMLLFTKNDTYIEIIQLLRMFMNKSVVPYRGDRYTAAIFMAPYFEDYLNNYNYGMLFKRNLKHMVNMESDPVLQFRTPFYATDPTFSNSAGII